MNVNYNSFKTVDDLMTSDPYCLCVFVCVVKCVSRGLSLWQDPLWRSWIHSYTKAASARTSWKQQYRGSQVCCIICSCKVMTLFSYYWGFLVVSAELTHQLIRKTLKMCSAEKAPGIVWKPLTYSILIIYCHLVVIQDTTALHQIKNKGLTVLHETLNFILLRWLQM